MLYLQKFEFWQHLCHYEVCSMKKHTLTFNSHLHVCIT